MADHRQCNENAFDVTAAILSRNFCAKKLQCATAQCACCTVELCCINNQTNMASSESGDDILANSCSTLVRSIANQMRSLKLRAKKKQKNMTVTSQLTH